MSTYIACPRRKGKPKIAVEVCRQCRHRRKCKTYEAWLNPPLFPPSGRPRLP